MEITRKLFTVNLYNYLEEDKAKVCKEYQLRNERIINETNDYLSDTYGRRWEYTKIDIDEDLDAIVKDASKCMIESLPLKYKYQMISDLVRYRYLMINPDSIYIDTDFCLFGQLGMAVLDKMAESARETGIDLLAGEMNKNRLFPCNWLMIGSGNENSIFIDMYSDLMEKLSVEFYESYIPSPEIANKWPNKLEAYIWEMLWGYAIPRNLSTKKYSMIPYENFQGCEWNKDWRDDSIMKKYKLVGCHFFGFGEGGRPDCDEFIKYHKLEKNV